MDKTKRNRFFFNCILLNVLLFSAAIFGVAWMLTSPTPAQQRKYSKLMAHADNAKTGTTTAPYKAKQERIGILKEVVFSDGPHRLKLRLKASDALLVLDHRAEDQTEIVENMNHVVCYMQEELFYVLPDGREVIEQRNGKFLLRNANPQDPASYIAKGDPGLKPMQIMRYMEADTASYFYRTDRFVADNVQITRYLIPGHLLATSFDKAKVLMKGVASTVEFSLDGQVNFKASKLKANFFTNRRNS